VRVWVWLPQDQITWVCAAVTPVAPPWLWASFGIVWLWIESWVGQAATAPVVLAWFAAPMRRRFLKRRIGHVRWTERRRRWERKQLKLLLGFVQLFLFGLSGFLLVRHVGGIGASDVVAGLAAGLLGIGAFILATTVGFRHLWGYGATLLLSALITVLAKAGPGGSLLASGSVIAAAGSVIFVRFLRANPTREAA